MKTKLGLLVLVLPLVSMADTVVPVDSVESFVNIRSEPEAGTEIVGRLQKGIPLTLVQSVPGWHEVEIDDEGTTGFVSADWSVVVADEPAEETVAEVVADEPAEEDAAAVGADQVVADAAAADVP